MKTIKTNNFIKTSQGMSADQIDQQIQQLEEQKLALEAAKDLQLEIDDKEGALNAALESGSLEGTDSIEWDPQDGVSAGGFEAEL